MDSPLRNARRFLLLSCLSLLLAACGGGGGGVSVGTPPASGAPPVPIPEIALTRFASGFTEPLQITHAGDGSGRIFVVERGGRIRIIQGGAVLPTPFLDMTALVQSTGSEQGLLNIVFPPGFQTKGYFYLDYTGHTGVGDVILARHFLTSDPNVGSAAGTTLLQVVKPFQNHNGGQLAFGRDGFLYMAVGDGGGAGDPFGNGQNVNSRLGKILRLDVESGAIPYAVPPSNPLGTEVWAYGLRNPWRFSFDRATGDLYIADVGQNRFEEIDVQAAGSRGGENYGWAVMEGNECFTDPACNKAGFVPPAAVYDHTLNNCSVTGGFVYRGAQYPALQGVYLYGDFCSGRIWGLRRVGGAWENQLLLDTALLISSFGEDEQGNIYVADFSGGDVYKVDLR